MIKLFLFDLGKVLIDFDFKIAIRRLKDFCPVDEEKIHSLFRDSSLAENWDKGDISSEEFFETVQKELNLPMDLNRFKEIWNDIFSEKREVIALAQALKLNYRVAVVSNTNPWHASHVREKFVWMKHWDAFIASCDVHLLKPNPKIFEMAIGRLGVRASETIYVDDIFENVAAAKKLGMEAWIFRSLPELLNALTLSEIELPKNFPPQARARRWESESLENNLSGLKKSC